MDNSILHRLQGAVKRSKGFLLSQPVLFNMNRCAPGKERWAPEIQYLLLYQIKRRIKPHFPPIKALDANVYTVFRLFIDLQGHGSGFLMDHIRGDLFKKPIFIFNQAISRVAGQNTLLPGLQRIITINGIACKITVV